MGGVSEGTLPGRDDIKYRYDEGSLSVWRHDADGTGELLYSGRAGSDGLYRDADGDVLGRDLGGSFAINAPGIVAMATPKTNSRANSDAQSASVATTQNPELCPPATKDEWKLRDSVSYRAQKYREQVTGLEFGYVVRLNGVKFDGCDTPTRNMLEAVAEGYENFVDSQGNWKPWYTGLQDEENQMARQSVAAAKDSRLVEWHVAQEPIADLYRRYAVRFPNVIVLYDPPRERASP